jgi:hypothetical protein
MKLLLSLYKRLAPEIELIDGQSDARRMFGLAVHSAVYRDAMFWVFLVVSSAVVTIAMVCFRLWLVPRVPFSVSWLTTLVGLWAGVFVGPGAMIVYRTRIRKQLRRDLCARGIPVCLHCGYNLLGVFQGRCPECGTKVNHSSEAPTLT